jgi:hypothetical protein
MEKGKTMNVAMLAAISIVLIGDSHSDFYGSKGDFGFFGRRLTQLFPHMTLYAVSNNKPSSWLANRSTSYGCTASVNGKLSGGKGFVIPPAKYLPKAELLVIEQGSNMVGHSNLREEINDLISAVQGKYTSLLWIGPPPARPDKISLGELKKLDAVIESCVLRFGSYYSSLSLHTDKILFCAANLMEHI